MNKNNKIQSELTAKDIETMSYVEFISFLKETNRCPGGKHTIRRIVQNTFIDRQSHVLEIGSNTGFTSLEIARTAKCSVVGIEPVAEAVQTSKNELHKDTQEIQNLVDFKVASAYELPFKDDNFDLVVAGGATSFMDEKERAIREYFRVLRPWGFLSITNLFYNSPPPAEVVQKVSAVIGAPIQAWGKDKWLEIFSENHLFELYLLETHDLPSRSQEEIKRYVEIFLNKPHIKELKDDVRKAIRDRWFNTINIFNENHQYLGYISAVFRKRFIEEEPELFIVGHK